MACPNCRNAEGTVAVTCWPARSDAGLRSRSTSSEASGGTNRMATPHSVQSQAGCSTVQPSSSSTVRAAGVRLRRRLSKIFPRDSGDSGFLTLTAGPLRCAASGGRRSLGQSQAMICQSPRIQRWRRFTSAS